MYDPIIIRTGEQTPTQMPTGAEVLKSLKVSWREQSKLITRLLEAREVDLASVAVLIDRSSNSVALSELRGIILDAVEDIKTIKREMEVKS